jgi:hypothetical protein
MVQISTADINKQLGLDSTGDATKLLDAEENNETSTIVSALAGIGSGLFKIPEGIISLGATIMDLGGDTDKAAEVEKFFAKINPFDELAEKTTAGKLTEIITNLAVPGGFAFKAGTNLAKSAIMAKQSGKYLDLGGDAAKAINKKLKGVEKLTKRDVNLVDDAFSKLATKGEKVKTFASGAGLGGLAEGVFVDDVTEVGSFGDLIGGPTKLERESNTPEDELLNRLKFGLEGAGFTGILGGLGATVRRLRNQTDKGRVADGKFNKFLNEWVAQSFRSSGKKTQPVFEGLNKQKGTADAGLNLAENAAFDLDKQINKLFPFMKRIFNNTDTVTGMNKLKSELNQTLLSGAVKGQLKPKYYNFELNQAGRRSGKTLDEVAADPKLQKRFTQKGFSVGFGKINKNIEKSFRASLKKAGASSAATDEILLNLNGMRSYWGNLFSSMGRRLDDKALKTFKETFGDKVTTWLDSGYEVFKNDRVNFLKKYKPANQIIKDTANQFKQIAKARNIDLNTETAEKLVNEVISSAKLEKGFKLKSASDPYFKVPGFFVAKSFAEKASKLKPKKIREIGDAPPIKLNLSDISSKPLKIKVDGKKLEINRKETIEKLLGKTDDAMSTILVGTNRLASLVTRNQMFDDLLRKSNQQRIAYDKWVDGGKQGPRPEAPIFVDSQVEATKYLNAGVDDIKDLRFDSGMDPSATLKPLDDIEKKLYKETEEKILNPLQNKLALKGNADAIMGVDNSIMGDGFGAQLYQNLVLYPKATSQMAKTILAPFTHARNFLSAGAFAAANGIIPFSDPKAVKQAFEALQIGGRTKGGNELYQELLQLGVVNSQVQLGDLTRLLKDVDFGATLGSVNSINGLFKSLSKIKKFAQDAYTAEDDFWKIFSWFGEKGRLAKRMDSAGMIRGKKYKDLNGEDFIFNDDWLKKEAANIVKNQIPNYAFVSEFVKGLRKFPLGNFVSFPAEIIRTSTNIVSRALDEISYTVNVKGVDVNPLKAVGIQRLVGMGITTTAVPYAAVSAGQMLYDVSKEELDAMRRFVPEWSKNSTLIPGRTEEGNLTYRDFSHMNAYDTVTRPIQTVLNAVQSGRNDKDGIMDDFILGLIDSTKELGSPFISESIWTEALQDVSPLLGRGGIDSEGRRIWNKKDSDGTKMYKALAHLIESQAPLNYKQLQRLGVSIVPIVAPDSTKKFNIRGDQYELGNELQAIAGLREVEIKPEKAFGYKIKDYKDGIRDSRNIFTAGTTKGGPITPEEIIDFYIASNKAMFETQRSLYKDIEAARIIGMKEDSIEDQMINRGERKAYNFMSEGEFRPLKISPSVQEIFEINAENLGVRNPFEQAEDIIDNIIDILEYVPLTSDYFPDLLNPFKNLPEPTLGPVGQLPPLVSGATPSVVNANAKFGNIPFTALPEEQQLEEFKKVFPNG